MDTATRPKRQKRESSKTEAFAKLKQVKSGGGKHKYEVGPMENVYEEVSEKEYTETVLKRQHDDWIEDDSAGGGYVEDGREIFDDDLDEESIEKNRKGGKKRDYSGKLRNVEPATGNIQKMIANMPTKKKKEVKLEDDDLLGNLMNELNSSCEKEAAKKVQVEKDYISQFQRAPVPERMKRPMVPEIGQAKQTREIAPKKIDMPVAARGSSAKDESFDDGYDFAAVNCDVEPVPEVVVKKAEAASTQNGCTSDVTFGDDCDFSAIPDAVLVADKGTGKPNTSSVQISPAIQENGANEKVTFNDDWGFLDFASEMPLAEEKNDKQPIIEHEPMVVDEKEGGEQSFKFYYWDAYEEPFSQPGTVYLFGKVPVKGSKTFNSCCVIVKDIERRIYLLPRTQKYDMATKQTTDEDVKMTDVYNEFNKNISERYRIKKFKCKKVEKKYAFDRADVPDVSEYLEIRYSANYSMLPSDLVGETFSHVFGTNTSFLELFLIEKRIKGPSWLNLVNPLPSNPLASWCKVEVVCDDMKNITVLNERTPPPPLVVMAVNMRITPIPKSHDNQVTMIGCLVHTRYHTDKTAPSPPFEQHFCCFTKPGDAAWPYDSKEVLGKCTETKLDKMDSERGLLSFFMAKFQLIDPDLIVGYDIYGFDIGTLIHRLISNKIMHWSRLGRLRRANIPHAGKNSNKSIIEKTVMCGRLLCDIKVSAKELIRARSYELDSLCQQVLHMEEGARKDVTTDEIRAMYSTSGSLINLVQLTMKDTSYILRIMYKLNVIPLSLQITSIAGNVFSRTLMGGRSERNEYLLLHAFNDKNYIVPDKVYGKRAKDTAADLSDAMNGLQVARGKRKPQYEGGMVLEPKRGFYDKLILLMDFNSLYPSIIQEFNICFTTVCVRGITCEDGDLMSLMAYLPSTTERGILPTEISKLVKSRKDVKNLMAKPDVSPDLRHQYDIRQLALKLTANSMYGCLGFPNSRFYAKPLAAMVTAKGREILMSTRDLVQRLNFDVVYGDTDSLMINTNCQDYDDVFKVGQQIKTEVNKLYKQIELDIDGVFKYMLLLKKKKYAAVTMSKVNGKVVLKQELKGLDIVRRDWSQLSCEAGKYVLNQILTDQNLEDKLASIHAKLNELKDHINENKVPLSLLAITKQLTKNPEDYPDKKALPHVQVALRMNKTLTKKFKQGDTIAYVICEDGTTNGATQRAYHVDELKEGNDKLKIDTKYYLSQQIHPVITRLCEPIDGIDAVQIAQSLGLDVAAYQHIRRMDADAEENDDVVMDEADKFKTCDKFEFRCLLCSQVNVLEIPVLTKENDVHVLALEKCTNASCSAVPIEHLSLLQNKLSLMIRSFIHKYYSNWMKCEDIVCDGRSRYVKELNKEADPMCPKCKKNILVREYTELDLYNQLNYFQYLFDITVAITKFKLSIPHDSLMYSNYCKLKKQVDSVLNRNSYNIIDFSIIVEHMMMKRSAF